jgi:hypothetical protein
MFRLYILTIIVSAASVHHRTDTKALPRTMGVISSRNLLQIQSVVTAHALDLLNSISDHRATRLEKKPCASTELKWITAALHEGDDLICKIFSAHIIGFVRWYFLVLGRCHLIQLLYSAEFNSRCSRKLTGAIHGSFGIGVVPVHNHKVSTRSHVRAKCREHVLLIEDAGDQRLAGCELTRTTGSYTLRRALPRSSV